MPGLSSLLDRSPGGSPTAAPERSSNCYSTRGFEAILRPPETRTPDTKVRDMWSLDSQKVAESPYNYVSSLPSKGARELFIEALSIWFDCGDEDVYFTKEVITMLHNSSLIIDDFQDNSPLRRGSPSTHMVFGPAQSINCASFVIVQAISNIQGSLGSSCVTKAIDIILTLFRGQAMELSWTFNCQCPSVQDYLLMVDDKTGALFRLACHLLASHSTMDRGEHVATSMGPLVSLLGQYFQIRDDYMNLVDSKYKSQKGFCEDLDEGKYSLPLIWALQNGSGHSLLPNMLSLRRQQGRLTVEQKRLMLDQIKASGSLEWTRSILKELQAAMIVEIESLERVMNKANHKLRALLDLLDV